MSEPGPQKATLSITRDTDDDVQDRWIRVWLDGTFWDILRYGKTLSTEVDPGHHTIKVSNTLTRDTLEFDARPGDSIKLRCHNSISKGGFLSILMIGVAPIKVRLERVA